MAKTVALYGGAFNPIHWGHLALALHMQQALRPELFFLMPSAGSPHKQVKTADQVSGEHRLAMCRLAAEELEKVKREGFSREDCSVFPLEDFFPRPKEPLPPIQASGFEVHRGGVSYTVDTLAACAQRYPGHELALIMGGDMFLTVDKWRRAETIFRLSTLVAAARTPGEQECLLKKAEELEAIGARCRVFPFPVLELSSTELRQRVRNGQSINGYTPSGVAAYIEEHSLYR